MTLTDNPDDPRLGHGTDDRPVPQNDTYLILPEDQRIPKQPVRTVYRHHACGVETRIASKLAETWAANPTFYGATYCVYCQMHRPVSEFVWVDGTPLGS